VRRLRGSARGSGGARLPPVERWDLRRVAWRPHNPEILSSSEEGRAIVLDLPSGAMLQDHQVHEGAWITVIDGAIAVEDHAGELVQAEAGVLVYLPPRERHEVRALSDARVLLLLTPWPGPGHPGTMTLEEKADVRARAAERAD
jgi:quercetin dioxygenase-like cupin family protein